jgi:REP element-mobilizing transposase RayT
MLPKGRHQRGYVPHRDYSGVLQAITFREAGSLPADVVALWKRELEEGLKSPDEAAQIIAKQELHRRIARYEDAGHGPCLLREADPARIVQEILLKGHGANYRLIAWCIMPNHVHVLIRQGVGHSLGEIVRAWKGGSARQINQVCQRSGPLWARDYFDRAIYDDDHFWNAVRYIHQNPVKAGLVSNPADWLFGSLGYGWPVPME